MAQFKFENTVHLLHLTYEEDKRLQSRMGGRYYPDQLRSEAWWTKWERENDLSEEGQISLDYEGNNREGEYVIPGSIIRVTLHDRTRATQRLFKKLQGDVAQALKH